MDQDRAVELGIDLLARLEYGEMDLVDVFDRIELVTEEPHLQERILDEAEEQGVIDRSERTVRVTSGTFLSFESEVTKKEGVFDCRRCGTALSTGYFMELPTGQFGPFGSSCIRKVTGRE